MYHGIRVGTTLIETADDGVAMAKGFRRLYRSAACRLALRVPPAATLLPARSPLSSVWHVAPARPGKDLIVMLPGIDDLAGDFARNGFIAALRRRGVDVDAVEVDTHLGYFLRRSLTERIYRDVLAPARLTKYERLWLVGISLGGLGSLLYAAERGRELAGIVLIAPFLGDARALRAIRRAGGPRAWDPQPLAAPDWASTVWAWAERRKEDPDGPELWLAFGNQDPFAPANRMLAEVLPDDRVFSLDGGHDWGSWRRLWELMLGAGLFRERVPGFRHRPG